jgi:threonine/homoserine/homoserine lactone efflux protein
MLIIWIPETHCYGIDPSPGPDTLYILGSTISQGTNSGIASVLGISTGVLIHTIAAAIGLSTI